jgi:membrane dipeptidase
MPLPGTAPIIDGHIDVLYAMEHEERGFFEESPRGQVDLPRLRRGGVAAAFCAVFFHTAGLTDGGLLRTLTMSDALRRLVAESAGAVQLVRDGADLERSLAPGGPFGAILHLEGADGLDEGLAALRVLHAAGLRSLGLVWSRQNRFAQGVGPHDTGDGLTAAGRRLVAECERLGILIDVSHLNDAGFWEAARLARRPFAATHSNARALAPHPRNLTDDQIRAIAAGGGVIGLNYHVGFIRPDLDHRQAETPLGLLVDHLDHMVNLVGIDHVALGSDYDGCRPPAAIGDVGKLPALIEALTDRGWREPDLARLCRENWRRLLTGLWSA